MNEILSSPPALQKPTRVRYGVLGFVSSLSMITYLDRVCWGAAMPSIIAALDLRNEGDLKGANTAFAITYALFEIPSGWLGDVYGPRKTLIRIVLWWSAFTAMTGLVGLSVAGVALGGLMTMVTIRALFGMGEAGAYPNITRALHNWFPFGERAAAQGTIWMAGRLMGGLTPFVWWALVEMLHLHWRGAFLLFGVIGVLWCIAFALWFRNRPEEKKEVNAAEQDLIRAGRHDTGAAHANVPWGRLVRSGNLWALCMMYFCAGYGWYFNITLLPTFLEKQFAVDPKSLVGALYKGGPLWMGAFSCLIGGWLSDRFIRATGNRKWGRRWFGVVGHSLSALCWLACLFAPNVFLFFLACSLAAFWNDLTMGASWAVCQDIGKRYAAIVAGCMNTIGNFGSAATGWVTGTILQSQSEGQMLRGYHINFLIFACAYVVATLLWLRIDSTEPVVEEAH
jgi:MFS family permease